MRAKTFGTGDYFHLDRLGSVSGVTNEAGSLLGFRFYDAFGIGTTQGAIPTYGYTGFNPDATAKDYAMGVVGLIPGIGVEAKAGAKALSAAEHTAEALSEASSLARSLPGEASAIAEKSGSFSIIDWAGYPSGVPKPTSSVNLISGAEYDASRSAANSANRAIHRADSSISPNQIHEIQPVKFGGSPTDPANKMIVEPSTHYQLNAWWKDLQRHVESNNGR